jgi:Flp pilus assembly protein TadG
MDVRASRGQATVEFVALLPVLVVVGFALVQLLFAGQAWWSAQAAAGAAARAAAVGGSAADAARERLSAASERGLRVRRDGDAVEVRLLVRGLPGLPGLGHVAARASFPEQG